MDNGYKVNDLMYVWYWRNSKEDEWSISQPVTLGEIIDNCELDFNDGGSLPLDDIDWGNDEVFIFPVPPRKYAPTSEQQEKEPRNDT